MRSRKEITYNPIRSNTKQFIHDANKKHGVTYDYSEVNYIDSFTKVIIKCYKHGKFFQLPSNHLQGNGCRKCQYENMILLQPKSTTDFVLEANKKHNNKYDYSLVNYKQAHSKITIICLFHGKFLQTPRHHLDGNGCPKCNHIISKVELQFLEYLKIPDTKENRQVKILKTRADGYDPKTNTIYEFLGDYWHGNPTRFIKEDINLRCHKTYGELYTDTFNRFNNLKEAGYTIKYIWESEWKTFKSKIANKPKIETY